MNKILVFCVIFFTLCLSLIWITVRNRLDIQTNGDHFDHLNRSLQVSFTPRNNNLNIIILHFKNPNLQNTENYTFSLTGPQNEILYQTQFSGRNIGDPSDLRFQFSPIPNSKDIPLTITLKPNSTISPVQVLVDRSGEVAYQAYYRTSFSPKSPLNYISTDPIFFIIWFIFLGLIYVI